MALVRVGGQLGDLREQAHARIHLAQRQAGDEEVIAGLIGGRVHLPGPRELLRGLGRLLLAE